MDGQDFAISMTALSVIIVCASMLYRSFMERRRWERETTQSHRLELMDMQQRFPDIYRETYGDVDPKAAADNNMRKAGITPRD